MKSSALKPLAPHPSGHAAAALPTRIRQFENHPAMPALLKELSPRAVAALFREVGVTDACVLMSVMPTRALLRAFDESVWKSATPGAPKTIDYRDLVDWLTAWREIDEQFLAQKLAALDDDYLSTLLSTLVTVESASRYAVYWEDLESLVGLCEDDRERVGPYIVLPIVEQDREIVMGAVRALWSFDADKILSILARLSDLANPADSPRGSATTFQDVDFARAAFGETEGFVSADGARAFLSFAERLTVPDILALETYDLETRRHLEAFARAADGGASQVSPVVADNFEGEDCDGASEESVDTESKQLGEQANTARLRELLEQSDLLPRQRPLALLQDLSKSNERPLTLALRLLGEHDAESFHARARELAYLANVLRWVPANGDQMLSDDAAKGAAFAICNLGYELAMSTKTREWDQEPGLIRDFLLGLNALSSVRSRVVGAFAAALSQSSTLAPWLQAEATAGLADLRRAVENGRFDEGQEAAIFLSIVFDSKVCRAVAPLLSAIPRFSTLLDGGHSNDWRWIETKADLQLIGRLLDSLRLKSGDRPPSK